jgi:hypothetical protein
MSNAQDKFRHFLLTHHYYHHSHQSEQLQANTEPAHVTILITTSKEVNKKSFIKSLSEPSKIDYLSKSVPCLVLYKHEDEYEQSQKIERSNSSHE